MALTAAHLGRRRRTLVAAAALAASIATVVGFADWLSSAHAFGDGGFTGGFGSVPTGVPAVVGLAHLNPSSAVRITSASALLWQGSAPADTSLLLCHPRPGAGRIGMLVGTSVLSEYCDRTQPMEGASLGPEDEVDGAYPVLTVVPRERGWIVVERLDIGFVRGWRTGVDRLATDLRVTAT
jgi:hypothetical protein